MTKRAKLPSAGTGAAAPAESTSRPPSREGTKLVAAHVPRATWVALSTLAAEEDSTIQALITEALDDLLARKRSGGSGVLKVADSAAPAALKKTPRRRSPR